MLVAPLSQCHAVCPRKVHGCPLLVLLLLLLLFHAGMNRAASQCSSCPVVGRAHTCRYFLKRRQKRYVTTAKFNSKSPTDQKDGKKKNCPRIRETPTLHYSSCPCKLIPWYLEFDDEMLALTYVEPLAKALCPMALWDCPLPLDA